MTASGTPANVPSTSVPAVPERRRDGPARNLAVRDLDGALDPVGKPAEARAQHDGGPRDERRPRADRGDCVVDHADPSTTRASKWETTNSTASAGASVTRTSSRSAGDTSPSSSIRVRIQSSMRRPVGGVEQHHREAADLARLHQRQRLEQLVERAEAAREDDEALRRLHEHDLARVEVLERQREVAVRVEALLVRELDVEADRQPPGLLAPAVRGLHHARPSTRDDGEPCAGEETGCLAGRDVGGRLLAHPCRPEDRDGRPVDLLHLLEAGEELRRDERHVARDRPVATTQHPAIELAVLHSLSCGM